MSREREIMGGTWHFCDKLCLLHSCWQISWRKGEGLDLKVCFARKHPGSRRSTPSCSASFRTLWRIFMWFLFFNQLMIQCHHLRIMTSPMHSIHPLFFTISGTTSGRGVLTWLESHDVTGSPGLCRRCKRPRCYTMRSLGSSWRCKIWRNIC